MRPALALAIVAVAACAPGCGKQLVVGDEAADAAGAGPASLLDGLVAYWRLDDRGTLRVGNDVRTADSSGNGNHATPESVSTTDWRAGHVGGALSFGQAGWLAAPFAANLNTIRTAVSVATWIRITSLEPRDQVILQRQAGTGPAAQFLLRLRAGRPGLDAPAGSTCDAPALPLGRWVHLAATYDGRTQRLAFDGQDVATCAASGALGDDTTGITVGAPQVGPGPFEVDKGRALRAELDEVMLFSRALGTAEIQGLAAGQLPPVR